MGNGWETPCPKREDQKHCECWYDGRPCCSCGTQDGDPNLEGRDE